MTKTKKFTNRKKQNCRALSIALVLTLFLGQGLLMPKQVHAAVAYSSAGTVAYSALRGTSIAPAYPATISAGNLLVLIVGMKPDTANGGAITDPTGWTLITSLTGAGGYGTALAADTGNTNLYAYYKVAAGTETGSLTITIADNNVSWAQIYRLTNATNGWGVAGTNGSDATTGTAVSIAMAANPGLLAGDFIFGAMAVPTDTAAFSAEAFSQSGAAFAAATELLEASSATGNDVGGFVARSSVTTAGTGNPTMSATAGTGTNAMGPGVFIRIREMQFTTLNNGTNPGNAALAPGGSITDLDSFTFSTGAGTDSVTALTVSLAPGTAAGLSEVRITSDNGATTYFSAVANPASDTVNFSGGTAIPVTVSPVQFKIRVTPKGHVAMPVPPGGTFAVTGTVTNYTCSNLIAGSDAGSATVSIDNASPADVTKFKAEPASAQATLTWTNPADADFSQVVILRKASSEVTDAPVEGTTYAQGNTIGASTVRYAGNLQTFLDNSGLVNGTTYFYKIFSKDTNGNYSTGADTAVNPPSWTNSPQLHNSYNLGSTKWAANSGWGLPGTKYGSIQCDTCHAKSTTNIKRVKTPVTSPNAPTDAFPGSTVNFQSYNTSATSMGDDTSNHTTSTRICEVCHSQTDYHKYNQTASTHQNNTDCASACHKHANGFFGDGACLDCHNAAMTGGVYNPRNVSADFTRLSRHVSNGLASPNIATNYDCVVCHAEGDAAKVASGSGWIDKTKHKNGTTSNGTVATDRMVKLRNVDSITQSYNFSKNVLPAANANATTAQKEQMRTDLDTFCLNCHDSDGASGLDVNGTAGLNVPAASGLTPFNTSDNLQNGRDLLTTRTRVVDVKSQLDPGTYKWNAGDTNMPTGFSASNYDGNPSQHAVLGPRYFGNNASWTATSWVNHTLRSTQVQNNASVREKAKLHCSDCHLSETNAHGATNAWHMLLNGTANDYTTDYAMGGVAPTTTASIVCYKCHSSAVYANVASTANTRFSHDREARVWAANYGDAATTDGAVLGPSCLLCHAGDGFGNIHGVSGTYTSNGDTFTRYRFMNGAWMYWDPGTSAGDAAWTDPAATAGTCYMPSSSTWAGCTQHSGGAAGTQTVNFGRAVKY